MRIRFAHKEKCNIEVEEATNTWFDDDGMNFSVFEYNGYYCCKDISREEYDKITSLLELDGHVNLSDYIFERHDGDNDEDDNGDGRDKETNETCFHENVVEDGSEDCDAGKPTEAEYAKSGFRENLTVAILALLFTGCAVAIWLWFW